MKKILLTFGIIIFTLTNLSFAGPRAEKLKFDENYWDYDLETGQLQVPLLCSFGIATAGEHAGFRASVYIEIRNLDGSLAGIGYGSGQIEIIEDNWDTEHYIGIAPILVDISSAEWNGDDDGSSTITGWVRLENSNGYVLNESSVEGLKITDMFPKLPGVWGRLANPGFHNKAIEATLFFSGQARDGSQYYECTPPDETWRYTVHPIDPRHLNWSANPTNPDFALGNMEAAGLNVVSMSSWGEDFLPCTSGWSISAPMQTAPGSHDELFEAAGNHDLVVIPLIESRGDWTLRDEFPVDANGDVAPGAVSQIVNLIERYLLNPEHPEWANRWAQVWDQSGQPRYAITFIHASSNHIRAGGDAGFAQGFDLIADEVFDQTGILVGFFIDPLPPNSNAPGLFKPSPESTGPELLKTESMLGIQSYIPEIWLSGSPSEAELIIYKYDYSLRWSQTGLPFLMDVSPGYDANIVFPDSIVYGFTLDWQNALTQMVHDFGQDGLVYNSWNGYTEGIAAVPTYEYGDKYYHWLQMLCNMVY